MNIKSKVVLSVVLTGLFMSIPEWFSHTHWVYKTFVLGVGWWQVYFAVVLVIVGLYLVKYLPSREER